MADDFAIDLVGDTSQAVDVVGNTSLAIDVIGAEGTPSSVTRREQPRSSFGGNLASSARRGSKQSAGLAGQLLKLIGDETGFAGAVDFGDDLIREAFVEAVSNPARIEGFDDIDSISKAGTFVVQTLGEQIPNLTVAALSGGIGAYAAKLAVGKAALQGVATQAAARGAVLKGAAAGTFTGFLPINTGEIIQEQRDAFESDSNAVNRNPDRAIAPPELGSSLALGAASSALEVLGFGLVGKAIFGAAKKEVIDHTLRTVLARIGHVSLKSLAAEGGTEAVQEAMVIASKKINDPTFSITDAISSSEGLSRIAFAGVSGAVVGGILGGAGGVATSLGDTTRAGLRATSLRAKALPGIAAMNEVFKQKTPVAEGQEEQAESLFDFRVLAKKYNEVAAKVTNAGKEAFEAAKNELPQHDQDLAVIAAREQQRKALDEMDFEVEEVENSISRLRQLRVNTLAAFVAVRNALNDIIAPSEEQQRSKQQNKAVNKMSKQVNELLAKAKKATTEERAQMAEEMLSLAQALAARAEFDHPLGVSKRHIKSLLSAGQKYANKGFSRVDTGLKNSLRVLRNARLRVANSLQGLPEVTQTEATEQRGATTSQQEINDSIDAVAKTGKAFAFAVGSKVENMAKAIVAKVKKLGLEMRQDGDRVIIAAPGNIDNQNPDAESFATPIEDIEGEGAVATTRNEEGRVVGNEAIPATVEAAQEATERGATEIRTPAEAITENTAQLNREAEAFELQLSIGQLERLIDQESIFFARVMSNGKPTNRIIEVNVNEQEALTRDDPSKPFALFETTEQIEKALGLKTSKKKMETIVPLDEEGNPQMDQMDYDTVEVNGKLLLRVKLPGGRTQLMERQVRRVLRRGNDTKGKQGQEKFVLPATRRSDGAKVTLHLGEVTRLGMMMDPGVTIKGDAGISNIQVHFNNGLAALIADYGYDVDFSPSKHGNKIVYGSKLQYKNAQLAAWKVKQLTGPLFAPYPIPNDAASVDELIDKVDSGELEIDDVESDLWAQGHFDPKEIVDVTGREELESESTVVVPPQQMNEHTKALHDVAVASGGTATITNEQGKKVGTVKVKKRDLQPKDLGVEPQTEATQVQNFLKWPAAQKAVEMVLGMLNIKQRVVLFNEESAPGLVAIYNNQIRNTTDKKQRQSLMYYRDRILAAMIADTSGRMIPPPRTAPTEEGIVHIFVSNRRDTPHDVSRGLVLMHEIGHLVQRTYLDKLSPELQAKVLSGFFTSKKERNKLIKEHGKEKAAEIILDKQQEAFANHMAKVAADMHFKKQITSKQDDAVSKIFWRLVNDLHRVWSAIKGDLDYSKPFNEFVAALNTHAEQQRGGTVRPLRTKLGKAIFAELQAADAGAFIQQGPVLSELDMTVEADVIERANDALFQKYFDDMMGWWGRLKENQADAAKMLVYTADAELRNMGQAGLWIAKQFHALPSSNDPSLTVFREIRIRAAPHHSALHSLLNHIPIGRIGLWESVYNKHPSKKTKALRAQRDAITEALLLETPDSQLSADIAPHVREIRSYLNNLYKWYTQEMGLPLQERKDYYPMMLDTLMVDKNRSKYVAILRKHKMSEAQAENHRIKITRDEDGGLNNGFQDDVNTDENFLGPGATFKKRRADRDIWTPELRAELVAEGFYQHDIATTLVAYTEMMVRRAVWERRYHDPNRTTLDSEGKPVVHSTPAERKAYEDRGLDINHPIAKLQMKLHLAKESGDINQWQFDRISGDILPAYAGQLGLRTNSHIRKLSATLVIYQNIRLLSLAVFSSFVDIGTLMARGDAWSNHKPALQLLLSKSGRAEAKIMLEAIGAMRQGLTEHVLNDQALNTFMTGSAKRINDKFFHYNQMEGWTNLMRAMALMSAREFMQRNAKVAVEGTGKAKAKATRYMNELGFDEAGIQKVYAWDGHSTTDIDIVAGLDRYVDESMIRPDASIRPVWMSDPGYGIFAHLKGFLYGFQETFLRRVGREIKIHQNYLPLLMLGMMALPFAAVGYELRKFITGSKRAPEGLDYFKEVVERSGLPGAFQLVVDMEQADDYGKPFGLGIGGPAVEQFYELMTKDMSAVLPKAIPVVAQSPVLRDWVRDRIE